MEYDLVKILRDTALAIDADKHDSARLVSGDILLEAAREIDYLRARVARLEGLA